MPTSPLPPPTPPKKDPIGDYYSTHCNVIWNVIKDLACPSGRRWYEVKKQTTWYNSFDSTHQVSPNARPFFPLRAPLPDNHGSRILLYICSESLAWHKNSPIWHSVLKGALLYKGSPVVGRYNAKRPERQKNRSNLGDRFKTWIEMAWRRKSTLLGVCIHVWERQIRILTKSTLYGLA